MNLVLTAFIDENNCIGCSKCIRVCPTDAIVGSKNVLHTIIPKYCTSCEECIAACPTNCIELKTPRNAMDPIYEQQLKQRKLDRLAKSKINNDENRTIHTPKSYNPEIYTPEPVQTVQSDSRKQQIMDAIARVKAKKNKINS